MDKKERKSRVRGALESAFELGSGNIPDFVEIELTRHNNVKITYNIESNESAKKRLNRYYIGFELRRELQDISSVEHEKSGGKSVTFVRW